MEAVKHTCICLLVLLAAGQVARAQNCTFGLPTAGPPCTDPALAGRQCPQVAFDVPIFWTPFQVLIALQCYREGGLVYARANAQPGAVTVGECVAEQVGDVEIKGWTGGPTPCSVSIHAIQPAAACAAAALTVLTPVDFDTPVTWTPSECVLTVQGYEKDQLVGQVREIPSGAATIGQISTHSSASLVVKIWAPGETQPSDTKTVTVQDCRSPKFTFSSAPGFDTPITWVLPGCVPDRIEAYLNGQLLGHFAEPRSGEKTFGDITGRQAGLIELRLYTSELVESRSVQISKCAAAFLGSFSDNFQLNKGWPDFITEEIPNPACYNTGVESFTRGLRYGKPSLCLTPNQAERNFSNHLIAGNRLADAGQQGVWSYVAWFYLPSDIPAFGETGPEISLQRTVPATSGTATYIAGLQHRTNPLDPAKVNTWAVWVANTTGDHWVAVATHAMPRNRWLKLELVADFDSNRYVRFAVTDGIALTFLTQQLTDWEIVPETRNFAPAFVATLEAENQNTCSNPQPTKTTVCYSDVAVRRLPLTLPSAVGLAVFTALRCE